MIESEHWSDNGVPAGGVTYGRGFAISWQNGPLGALGTSERKQPNGAFVEDIIEAALDRLEYYQSSRFNCDENQFAIEHLRAAIAALEERTARRVQRGVEGTHTV